MSDVDIQIEVRRIVSLVGENASLSAKDRFHEVLSLIGSIAKIENVESLVFRIDEYEIRLGLLVFLQSHIDILAMIEKLSLSAAQSLVEYVPINEREGVLIVRYAACPGETFARVESTVGPFREAASRRFRADMQTLIDHGLVHPFVRGPHHWLVSSETGTLVLDSWYALRECDPGEGAEMMAKVDRQLSSRSQATPSPPVRGTESFIMSSPSSRIEEVFGCPRVLLPVVHPVDESTAMTSVQVAVAAGVKGLFLINQGMSIDQVLELVMAVRSRFPTLWVGLNLLGLRPAHVLELGLEACAGRVDGIWTDNAYIDEAAAAQPAAQELVNTRRAHGWNGLYFGGVAFKYQREIPAADLGRAAAVALPYMDVVCTSGPGTGQPAEVDKVVAMRAGLGASGALALASGVTVDNVAGYLPYVDAYLVGTGIEHSFGILDPDRVAALQRTIMADRTP